MGWQDRDYHRDDCEGGMRFGGRLGGKSMVTWLLVINAIVFLLDAVLLGSARADGIAPSWWGNFNVEQGIFRFQIWRLFTYQFLHAGLMHIVFNMIALYFFGPMMEQWWGSKRFLAAYLLCGLAGAAAFAVAIPILPFTDWSSPIVGASACVTGIIVGAAVLFPKERVMLMIPPIPMQLWVLAAIFIGIDLLSVMVGSMNAGGSVAHLGGAALGFLLVKRPRLLDWADRFSPSAIQDNVNKGRWERKQKQRLEQEQELDRILAKVKDHGLHALSRREKKVLQQATDEKRRAG